MASTSLSRTTTAGTSYKKFTFSFWGKLSDPVATSSTFFGEYYNATNYTFWNVKDTSGDLQIMGYDGGSYEYNLITDRQLKDVNGWYHIVVAFDSTQATASDRIKVYINGVQETSFSTETYPSLNLAPRIANGNRTQYVGQPGGNSNYWNGTMAHVHYISDTAYAASDFGSTDSTTGIWKPKTAPSVTYGTEGFFLDFASSSDMGNDVSGNDNDLTVSGTITQTIDTPSNVFATMNPLNYTSPSITYSNGNTKTTHGNAWTASLATLGVSSGKYYWEGKVVSANNQNLFYGICIANVDLDTAPQNKSGVISQHINGDRYVDTTYTASAAEALTNGDIIGVALDLDSATKNVKFYKNGSLLTSSSSVNLTSTFDDEIVFPMFIGTSESANASWEVNYGNGYFGTTAVSSAGTNSGIGTFEYDVPSGYKALCTRNINEQEYS